MGRERPQSTRSNLTVATAIAVAGSALFLAIAASRCVAVGAAAASLAGRTADLGVPLRHDDRKSLQHWLASQARYMRLEADKLRSRSWGELDWPDRLRKMRIVAPGAVFIYCLFGKGLVLDGRAGLFYALQRATSGLVLSLTLLRDDLAGIGGNP